MSSMRAQGVTGGESVRIIVVRSGSLVWLGSLRDSRVAVT